MKAVLARLQPLGRALMLPIAVLPVAGLLLRLGQPDLLDISFIAAAGNAIFGHLGLLFAIGVAVGLARENHGAAGLAGAVAYFVTVEGAKTLLTVPPDVGVGMADAARDTVVAAWREAQLNRLSVPAGILSGLAGGLFYNRYAEIKLPDFLAFFGGRRFVPIMCGLVGLVLALVFGLGFPLLSSAIDTLSRWIVGAGPIGLFLFGVLNRLLIVTGLHHILNNVAWFILGDFHGATGDLKRFFAGDPHAGAFMAGFFPVMMFGLPAACLAMYHAALPERRKAVGGLLLSIAATSFLTGVTEPIEFSFMFLAPALYALHAVLTGLSMALMDWLGVRLGFGFSAGLFDYVLNYGIATRPLLLLPVGLGYGFIYYASFSWAIRRFDLKTPGREPAEQAVAPVRATGDRGARFLEALGGAANVVAIDACTTRLRLRVADLDRIDEGTLKALGARGVFRPGADALQVVLGPIADQVASEIRAAFRQGPADMAGLAAILSPLEPIALSVRDTRLLLQVTKPAGADVQQALRQAGTRAVTASANVIHLVVGPDAPAFGDRLAHALGIVTAPRFRIDN
jgi:PTS system N-acetylglucosamine-specific IIC component